MVNKGAIGNTASDILEQLDSGELDDTIKNAQIITITCGGNDLMLALYEKTAYYYNLYFSPKIETSDVIVILANNSDSRYQMVQLSALTALGSMDTSEEFNNALNNYISNINTATAKIKAINPNVKIYLETQYNPYEHFTTWESISKPMTRCINKLNEAIVNNAEAGQYTVVDVYKAFSGNTATYCNASETGSLNLDFHPSVAGHAVIAKCFAEVVPQAKVTPDSSPDPSPSPAPDSGSSSGSSEKQSNSPATGDNSMPLAAAGAMIASAAGIAVLIGRKIRHRHIEN